MDKHQNEITEGIIWKQLLLFFFPIVFGTLFQQVYNTADTIIVGRFVGKEALAAVGGTASQMVNLVVGFFVGLSSGASVVIAQFYGAEDRENLSKTIHTSIGFCIAASVIFMVIGFGFSEKILRITNLPEEIMKDSLMYINIYFGGIFFNLIYNMGSGILRAMGDSKRPVYVLITTCIINIILDLVFVVCLKLGVKGVALATVISQIISAGIITRMLMNKKQLVYLVPKKIYIHKSLMKNILRIGIPAGLESVMYNISNILIQSFINLLGTETVAAWGTHGKIDAIFWMIVNAYAVAITTFVGQNYGAGKITRMRKSVKVCMAMALGTSVGMIIIMLSAAEFIYGIFTKDASVVAAGVHIMRIFMPFYPLYVIIGILSGAFRGKGTVLIPLLLTCGGVCTLRIIWLMTVVKAYISIDNIILSYPISWIITAVLFVIYYVKKFPREERE